jgi:hypothetical protein
LPAALEPDYRRRLWPVLAGSLETSGLLVFTWRDGGPPAPRPLQELGSRRVGRHTYTVLSEILDADREACRARYVHRVTEGDTTSSLISPMVAHHAARQVTVPCHQPAAVDRHSGSSDTRVRH